MGDSIELGIILTRMVQRANHRRHARVRRASSNRYHQLLGRICAEYWIVRRSLSSGGALRRPVGGRWRRV